MCRREFSFGGLLADRGFLGESFRPDIGGKQLRVAFFHAEVCGPMVAEELVAMTNEKLVDADHCGFGCRRIAENIGDGIADARPWLSRKGAIHSKPHSSGRTTRFSSRVVSRVSQSYIQRAYHSLIIDIVQFYQRSRTDRGHGAGRDSVRSLPTQLCPLECDQPAETEECNESNNRLRDDAIKAPDLQDVPFNMAEIESESQPRKAATRSRPAAAPKPESPAAM